MTEFVKSAGDIISANYGLLLMLFSLWRLYKRLDDQMKRLDDQMKILVDRLISLGSKVDEHREDVVDFYKDVANLAKGVDQENDKTRASIIANHDHTNQQYRVIDQWRKILRARQKHVERRVEHLESQ